MFEYKSNYVCSVLLSVGHQGLDGCQCPLVAARGHYLSGHVLDIIIYPGPAYLGSGLLQRPLCTPYFDPRMLVIDPMHNLFLGTTKHIMKDLWMGILTSTVFKWYRQHAHSKEDSL